MAAPRFLPWWLGGEADRVDGGVMIPKPDALPERPEPMDDPLPEDLERVLRDPEFVTDQDYALHFWLADYVRRHPDETVTSRAYLGLWALYERTLRDADA